MSGQTSKRLMRNHIKDVILIFSALPIIVYLKWVYDNHLLLGTVASPLLALRIMEMGKKDD
ncbi:MAG: hypothetical protein OXE78_09955 [Gammaproteobacteria bacterium]|nr:hypothetical protein [Gammaproteobacteria bacterium]MCY4356233.1 hypothetical protein [Gammaproteobacteria bacterium]